MLVAHYAPLCSHFRPGERIGRHSCLTALRRRQHSPRWWFAPWATLAATLLPFLVSVHGGVAFLQLSRPGCLSQSCGYKAVTPRPVQQLECTFAFRIRACCSLPGKPSCYDGLVLPFRPPTPYLGSSRPLMAGFVESAGPFASSSCPPLVLNRCGLAALPCAPGRGPHRGSARRAALGREVANFGLCGGAARPSGPNQPRRPRVGWRSRSSLALANFSISVSNRNKIWPAGDAQIAL